MAITTTDLLLVNRAGTDYKMASNLAMTKVQATDVLLINRAGVDYKITGAKFLAGNFLDTDLFLVNRGGVDYKATGALMRAILQRAAVIGTVVLSEEDAAAPAFTSQKFKTTITLTDAGQPAATIGLKAYVQGRLTGTIVSTNAITATTTLAPSSWGEHPDAKEPSSSFSVLYLGNDRWIKCGSGGRMQISTDNGATWTTTQAASQNCYALARRPDTGLLMTAAGGVALTSSDGGATWTTRSRCTKGPGETVRRIIFGDGVWMASGDFDYACVSHDDGATWQQSDVQAGVSNFRGLSYRNSVFYLQGVVATTYRSIDKGITWQASGTLPSFDPKATHYIQYATWGLDGSGQPLLVLVGGESSVSGVNRDIIYTSPDGANWTLRPALTSTYGFNGVSYIDGMWVAAGFIIATSLDGITWKNTHTPRQSLWMVNTSGGKWIAVGNDAQTLLSAYPLGATRITLAGAFTDGFRANDRVTSEPAGAGPSYLAEVDDTQVTIAPPSNAWAVGQKIKTTKAADGVRLYLKFNAAGAVTDMQSADPGFVTMTNSVAPELTFPATFPSGNAPDVELPNGTTITTVVEAKNTAGAPTKTSNTVTPAR
jgi:photosystem II stability/assembly factor-like uncharacterized protein